MSGGHSLSFVLLPTSSMPAITEFRAAWQEVMHGAAAPVAKVWGDETVEVEVEGITTIATLMPLPVPNGEADAASSRSVSSLREGGFTPAPHVAHLMVASTSPTASTVDRLVRHARVVAALAKATHATGVYEGGAHATHDPAFYAQVVSSGTALPLMLWNGVSLARKAESFEVLTLGMAQLELPDLLLVGPADPGNDILAFAFDLLGYVVSRGKAIAAGETVGRTAEEKLPVTYVPSPIEPAREVMKVELPATKKRWWPFGGN